MKLSDLGEPWVVKREIVIIVLLYGTGLRISEALNLRVSDINNESIIVTGKGDKQRQVFILPVVKKCIQEYVKACPYLDEAQHLFVGVRGKKLGRAYVANRLQKIKRMLNLPEILSPHAFRHSFATHLLQEDIDIRSIQQPLGHSSLETTQVYTHLNYQDVFNMYKNFQQSLEKKSKPLYSSFYNNPNRP
nr:tyrosine-type recombinase/integrase [Wolbachia endosymbiont of Glossina morsitans morsitans]